MANLAHVSLDGTPKSIEADLSDGTPYNVQNVSTTLIYYVQQTDANGAPSGDRIKDANILLPYEFVQITPDANQTFYAWTNGSPARLART